jgi:hypothetical protein
VQFHLEGGYDFLYALLVQLLTNDTQNDAIITCKDCLFMSPNHAMMMSTLETDLGKQPLFLNDTHTRITFMLLSLLFHRDLNPTLLLTYIDSSLSPITQQQQHQQQQQQQHQDNSLQLNNLHILRMIFKFIEQEDFSSLSLFGLSLLELILRLNPLSVVGMQTEGGLLILQKFLISSIFVPSIHLSTHEDITLSFLQRSDRSRSTSSGTSSSRSSTVSIDTSMIVLPQQEYQSQLESALAKSVHTIQLLVRISVIFSARTASILNLFVTIVQLIAQRLNPLTSSWTPQEKCSNCEAEIAEFECTHHRSFIPHTFCFLTLVFKVARGMD